jgi:hypothetical protein
MWQISLFSWATEVIFGEFCGHFHEFLSHFVPWLTLVGALTGCEPRQLPKSKTLGGLSSVKIYTSHSQLYSDDAMMHTMIMIQIWSVFQIRLDHTFSFKFNFEKFRYQVNANVIRFICSILTWCNDTCSDNYQNRISQYFKYVLFILSIKIQFEKFTYRY